MKPALTVGRPNPVTAPFFFRNKNSKPISAFSALEGLGLQLDEQYSIVNECFPYLARRLLTEDSDRMHKMLRTFLYGKDGRYLKVRRKDKGMWRVVFVVSCKRPRGPACCCCCCFVVVLVGYVG